MAASAAGCGSKDTAKGGVQNITWYTEVSGGGNDAMWDSAEVLKRLLKKPESVLKSQAPADGGNTKLNLMLSTGDMPDLITFDATNSSTMEDLVNKKPFIQWTKLRRSMKTDFLTKSPRL